MFERLKRVIRSIIGWFIELGEDPELILRQNIRDMEDQIPEMNRSIAMVKANQTLLEKELSKLKAQESSLAAKIKAALKNGRRDLALNFATTLEQVRADMAATEGQLKLAKESYEKMLRVKQMFLREKERKTREALAAIQARKRAEWQAKVADAMESFKIAGIDATHDEMIRRIEETAAVKEAQLSMALDNVDHESYEIEEEARKLEANETLKQFEIELGLVSPEESGGVEPAASGDDAGEEKEKEQAGTAVKTMGPAERA